eukprot:2425688-Pleurochrysis_carterae.AAC.1
MRKADFIDLFSPFHPSLVAFRKDRFVHYMNAACNSQLDLKPEPRLKLPRTHMYLHTPIWDRLQSSYDDVNAELETIRNHPTHRHSTVVFIGCDGAGYS